MVSLSRWGTWGGPLGKGAEQIVSQASVPCPKMRCTPDEPLHLGSVPQGHHFCHRGLGRRVYPLPCTLPRGDGSHLGESRGALQRAPCSNPPLQSRFPTPHSSVLSLLGSLEILLEAVVNVLLQELAHTRPFQRCPDSQRPGHTSQDTGPKVSLHSSPTYQIGLIFCFVA